MEFIFGTLIAIILAIAAFKAGIALFFWFWVPCVTLALIYFCFDTKHPYTMGLTLLSLLVFAALDHYLFHLWYNQLWTATGEGLWQVTVVWAQKWYGMKDGFVQYYSVWIMIYPLNYHVYPAAFVFPPIARAMVPIFFLLVEWWYTPDIDIDKYVQTLDAEVIQAGMYQGSLEAPPASWGSQIAAKKLHSLADRLRAEVELVRQARQYKLERARNERKE